MDLKEIATVAGKGGLFKVVKPTHNGVILESIDDQKTKMVANVNSRVSLLHEISIYTTTQEGSEPLENIFTTIYKEFQDDTGVDKNSDGDELKAFLKHILPEYDESRVYVSDIKKLVTWYDVLVKNMPEFFTQTDSENQQEQDDAQE